MVKSVKHRTRRTRRTRRMRNRIARGPGFSRPTESIFTKKDELKAFEDFRNGKFPQKYEKARRKRMAEEDRIRRMQITSPPSSPKFVTQILSATSGNPSGIPDQYIEDFINSFPISFDEETKNKLRNALQNKIRYDSEWVDEVFSQEILKDEEEQVIAKVQIWLKEGLGDNLINQPISGKANLIPFKKLREFRNNPSKFNH